MKTIIRDDTEHGEEYVLRSEALAEIQEAVEQANARQNAAWRLMCDKMVAAERERILSLASNRAAYESLVAKHHARNHLAFEWHTTRHAAMRDLIEAISTAPGPAP